MMQSVKAPFETQDRKIKGIGKMNRKNAGFKMPCLTNPMGSENSGND
jgi:hypothetical protein